MRTIFAAIKQSPARIAAIAVVAAAVLVPAGLFAWGPSRATFTQANPATYVTFNSITDNAVVGDERQFLGARDASITTDGQWSKDVTVQPGKEYTVRLYVHNNAADHLNLKAINTRVSASIPTTTGTNVGISGFVSADNANPNKVWADVNFKSEGGKQFNLAYVPGSARVYNNGYAKGGNGQPLPDSIVTSAGAQIGYESANGEVPGCFKYVNYVYFKVKPQFAQAQDFSVSKTVSPAGKNAWKDSITANGGETVDYRIAYKNNGPATQNNVVLKDTLPAEMNYVSGSTKLYNNAHTNGSVLSDNLTKTQGVNIGTHVAGSSSYVTFSAKIKNAAELKCGLNTLTNKVRVETDHGNKEDTAVVTVNRTCKPGEISVCDLTTKQIVSIQEKDFNPSKYSKNFADCKIKVCDLITKEIVTINSSDFDSSKYSKSTADCQEVPAEMPQTGISGGATLAGLALLAAGLAYAVRSPRIRNLIVG